MTQLGDPSQSKRPLRRWWPWLLVGLLLLTLAGALTDNSDEKNRDQAATLGASSPDTPAPSSATDPVQAARVTARTLGRRGEFTAAAAAYDAVGLTRDADRMRRRGADVLSRSARRALRRGRYATARRLAIASRRMHNGTAARGILTRANTAIAKANAAARERRRLARLALDARTCSSGEKRTVREDAGVPAGCTSYAADVAARDAAKTQAQSADCDPNYAGACLKPDSPDYDCAGGSGDGPDYTGTVRVVGGDPYDLDRDGDGVACDT
jgi:hypothetical protein